MRRLLSVAVALVTIATASSAHADDEGAAREAMRRGASAFGRGDAAAALAEYEQAKALAPMANAPYLYAAEALIRLQRWRDAVENFEGYLAKNPDVSDANEVRARIAQIRADHYPGYVIVTAEPPQGVVTIDGEVRGAPGRFEVAAGKHVVEVSAEGREHAAKEIAVVGEAETQVSFVLVAKTHEPAPAERVEPRSPLEEPRPWKTIGWVTAGAGAASIATAIIVDTAILGPRMADYRAAAAEGNLEARALRSEADDLRTGALVGYVAGATLMLAGAALVLFAPDRKLALAPAVGPRSAGASVRFAF